MAIVRVETQRRIVVDSDPTVAGALPTVASVGDVVYDTSSELSYQMTAAGLVPESELDQSPVFDSIAIGAAAGSAGSVSTLVKQVTGITDAEATAVLTVTVPNSAQSAALKVRLIGSLGAGGAIGANEASGTITYDVVLARTAGVNVVAAISDGYGSDTAAVSGAATITVAGALSSITGAVGAVNTFTVNVTITKGDGASDDHTCLVVAELANANASGVTIA